MSLNVADLGASAAVGCTSVVAVRVVRLPAVSVTVSVTVYVPPWAYAWLTFDPLEVVPSPNAQV